MYSFISFINSMLTEEKATSEDFGSLGKTEKGVLHELLVGYHLRRGQHMDKHPDINGKSPREVHDELSSQLNSTQYKNFSDRAKKAADDILKERKMSPKDIANVQWTSKPGDIKRATGIESTQTEDDSDIIMTHRDGTHHGISLKVSDDSKPITLSNNGANQTYGGDEIFDTHKKGIIADYPELKNLSGNEELRKAAVERAVKKAASKGKKIDPATVKVKAEDLRKVWLEKTPGAKENMNKRTTVMLRSVMNNMHNEVTKLQPQELADHIRNSVLHAYKTPKEEFGHTHMRHFTGGGFNPEIHTKRPGEDYEHFLAKPENLRATVSGANITYHHFDEETGKNIPFAIQTAKVSSRSDPMSSLVVVGKDVERKQDIATKERIRQNHLASQASTAVKPAVKPVANPESEPSPTSQLQPRKPTNMFSTVRSASGDWRQNQTHSQNLAGSMTHGTGWHTASEQQEMAKGLG
jgi:hypothetical protein